MTLKELLKIRSFVLLDGAVGTELEHLGYQTTLPLWSASATMEAPSLLQRVHESYCEAGADIITANTIRSSRHTFRKIGREAEARNYTKRALEIGRSAVLASGKEDVLVAGSIAPLEDCYDPSAMPDVSTVRLEYEYTAQLMLELKADLCLIETMINRDEAMVISETMARYGIPYLISFTAGNNGKLLDGSTLTDVIEAILPFQPDGVLLNCRQPSVLTTNLRRISAMKLDIPYGAYGNVTGSAGGNTGMIWDRGEQTDVAYNMEVVKWIETGARIFGGCCGTTPDTINRLRSVLTDSLQ